MFDLEKAFSENPYPSAFEKEEIAARTGLEFKQIHTWVCLSLASLSHYTQLCSSKIDVIVQNEREKIFKSWFS